jgi:ankyrin repeat protein
MSAPGKAQMKPAAPTRDLWQIAEVGDLGQLEKALARGADVNACNGSGVTPLMVAAYHGRHEMVNALVEHGAELNAVDSDGLTAAMLADDAGHEEIVRTLVKLGIRKGPTTHAPESEPNRSAQYETSDATTDPAVAPPAKDPKVRTLHEPPEIWDLVHETKTGFSPGSALVGRLTSLRFLALAAMLLIIAGGAVFWFMRPRDSSVSATTKPPVQADSGNIKAVSIPKPTELATTAPSTDQPATGTPVETKTADRTIDEPKPDIAASAALSGSKVLAEPTRPNPTIPGTRNSKVETRNAIGATVADTRNRDRARGGFGFENNSATVARPDNKDSGQTSTTPSSKSDKEKNANPTAAKKEADKILSPPVIAPPKAAPTPKAKVIQWP